MIELKWIVIVGIIFDELRARINLAAMKAARRILYESKN